MHKNHRKTIQYFSEEMTCLKTEIREYSKAKNILEFDLALNNPSEISLIEIIPFDIEIPYNNSGIIRCFFIFEK